MTSLVSRSQAGGTTIASGAADCSINIWERNTCEAKFQLLQSITFGSGFVFGVDLYCLYGHLMLACGTETGKVEVHVKQGKEVGL